MEFTILSVCLLITISFVISLFGSIVGFGGGLFIVPILITAFHFNLGDAVAAVMVSLIPSSVISTYLNSGRDSVDFKVGVLLETPTMVGVILGSLFMSFITAKSIEIIFALIVILLGLSFLVKFKAEKNSKQNFITRLNKMKPGIIIKNEKNAVEYHINFILLLFFGLISGSLAGLFGVGGGFLKTPIMIKAFKIPAKIAASTALFMIIITSITGTISYAIQGHIHLGYAWPIMLGFAGGALLGHKFTLKIKEKTLEIMIGAALIMAGLVMTYNFIN